MKKEKTEKREKELRSYLKDKFTGILAREKWDMDDIGDVLDSVKELLQFEREEWEKEKVMAIYKRILDKIKRKQGTDEFYETIVKPIEKRVKNQLLEKIDEIIDDNNDLFRWQKEELKDEIKKELNL